ncbi:MAG: adenylosuccinate lyase family protein [Thermaerobacter sp.]|nr:adenylosuccinate lyase family protein [Thermaerobacter sp.]
MFGDEGAARIFSDERVVEYWCRAEVALAQAEAELGVIPRAAAEAITRSVRPEKVDLERLAEGTLRVGYPILPLVRILEEMVGAEAGEHIHWGATTQDIMDTAVALQMQDLHRMVAGLLDQLGDLLAERVRRHKSTPMPGRTHGQQAVPITLGLKFGVWLDEIRRHRERWREIAGRIGFGQLSGAAGTLASLGAMGPRVQERMCNILGLKAPPIGWHSARDTLAEIVSVLGLVAGTLGKMAGEVAALQRNEIAELSEGFLPDRGSSSTMPQKRNPITSETMVAQAAYIRQQVPLLTYAMTAVHERATGEWQVEWIVLPEVGVMAVGLLKNAISLLEHLVVDEEAMLRNLSLTRGLIVAERVMMALASHLGRQASHELVYAASARAIDERRPLLEVLGENGAVTRHLSPSGLAELLDPTAYLGNAPHFAEAALRAYEADRARSGKPRRR